MCERLDNLYIYNLYLQEVTDIGKNVLKSRQGRTGKFGDESKPTFYSTRRSTPITFTFLKDVEKQLYKK